MKILMVCEFFDDKLEYQENLLLKYYSEAGHKVVIVSSTIGSIFDYVSDADRGKGVEEVVGVGSAKVIRLPFKVNIMDRIKIFPSLKAIFRDEAPDLIYFHDIIPNIIEGAAYVRGNPDCRMIMDYHADYSNSGKNWVSLKILHGVIRKFFLKKALGQLSHIFPVVPEARRFLHEVYDVPLDQMEVLPLGTDLDAGAAASVRGAGALRREALGIPSDAFVVFTGGKLNPFKGTEHLIDAARAIGDPRLHVLVAGVVEPSQREYGQMLQERAGGDARIHFLGWMDREGVYECLDASDVAVFPASQSVLWQQALGMGLPIIVGEQSDIQPLRQDVGYLNLYDNVVVLDPQRPRAREIEGHLRALMADPALLENMSAGAARTARELLDWRKLIARTLRFNDQPALSG